jgi:hypothetical protein
MATVIGYHVDYTRHYTVFIVHAYQTSQHAVPRGGIFLGKWRSAFAGSSDGKMNTQYLLTRGSDHLILTQVT